MQRLRCFGDGWLRPIRTNSTCIRMYATVVECCTLAPSFSFFCRRCRLAGALHMISVGSKPHTSFAAWHSKACRDRSAFVCPSRTRITGCLQVENQQNVYMDVLHRRCTEHVCAIISHSSAIKCTAVLVEVTSDFKHDSLA